MDSNTQQFISTKAMYRDKLNNASLTKIFREFAQVINYFLQLVESPSS